MNPRIVIPTLALGALGLALALSSAKATAPRAALAQPSSQDAVQPGVQGPQAASLLAPGRNAKRSFELLAAAPDLDAARIQTLMQDSDRMRALAEEQGEHDLGAELRRRMAEIEVTEQEAAAFFAQESSLFGERSFEESRAAIRQMLVIRKTRAEYGIPR